MHYVGRQNMSDQSARLLGRSGGAVLLFSIGVYALGAYQISAQLCKHIGPNIAALAVAIAVFAAGILCARALLVRSAASWVTFLGTLLLAGVLYFLIGVMALPGCSGV